VTISSKPGAIQMCQKCFALFGSEDARRRCGGGGGSGSGGGGG